MYNPPPPSNQDVLIRCWVSQPGISRLSIPPLIICAVLDHLVDLPQSQ